MIKTITINVGSDFSRTPGPRKISDGKFSGERFYKKHLVPAFLNFDKIIIEMDGTEGYGSSFIDEAFRSLVSDLNLSKDEIFSRIEIISLEDEIYKEDAIDAINQAEKS